MYGHITACRSCNSSRIEPVLDLGHSPLADRLLSEGQLAGPEASYPLQLVFCHDCSLVQIDYTVPPEELFCNDYPYFSSVSDELQRHTVANVRELIERRRLGPDSLVMELASNDGYLLKHYQAAGIRVLGIDPAEPPAKAAQAIGVETGSRSSLSERRLSSRPKGPRPTWCTPTTCSPMSPTPMASSPGSRGC
jgi:hypothetical protein